MKIYIINGANLNLLGTREPQIYGSKTLSDVNSELAEKFSEHELVFFQSNCEGLIIDKLHEGGIACGTACGGADSGGIVLNPGAYTHYSYAIRDAVASINVPVIEVHISDITKREGFRQNSVITDVCKGTVMGKGTAGYTEAVEILLKRTEK
jgi:3-dehydroquinate dehydratase-2